MDVKFYKKGQAMKILYISTMASQNALNDAVKKDPSFNGHAIQKFTRLIYKGLVCNGLEVQALSTFFLPNVGSYYSRKSEIENGVQITYIPSPSFRPLRIIWLIIYCFCKVFLWGLFNRKGKVVICDILNVSACTGTLAACHILRMRCCGLMTDMPGIGVGNKHISDSGGKRKIPFAARINRSYLNKFTHYVFITEQMNEAVNTNHRPYIVMEGLVDTDFDISNIHHKSNKRIILYAGGLHERYGLKLLVDGFIKANVENTELWLYGSGPFVKELLTYCEQDSRIKYKGIRPNEEVVEAELKATLLVNPRPTHEEFTKYSFPSKNMEYMVSGTPLLTTILPGMPKEYYTHVYLFDKGETTEGYAQVLSRILALPDEELIDKGMKAREWIMKNKNYITQTARIARMMA